MSFWKTLFGVKESSKSGIARTGSPPATAASGSLPRATQAAANRFQPARSQPKTVAAGSQVASLLTAVKGGNLREVRALIKNNPTLVFSKDNKGMTPLHWAVKCDRRDVVKFLLANGAEVNGKDKEGATSLHLAAANDRRDLAELLLGKNAEVNAKSNDGQTPLDTALLTGHENVGALLREHRGHLTQRPDTPSPQPPSTRSVEAGSPTPRRGGSGDLGKEVISETYSSPPPSKETGKTGSSEALTEAVRDGNVERIRAITAAGADVNAKSKLLGMTELIRAAALGNSGVLKALIAAGADVNASMDDGQTALMQAAYYADGHGDSDGADCVRILISAGANVNAKDNDGETALMRAARGGNADTVRALIAAGADVNAKHTNGDTVLIIASGSQEGAADKIQALIAAGANVNTRDSKGNTALSLRERYGDKEVAELLRQHGGRGERAVSGSKTAKSAFDRHMERYRSQLKNPDSATVGVLAAIQNAFDRSTLDIGDKVSLAETGEDSFFSVCYKDLKLRLAVSAFRCSNDKAYTRFAQYGGYLAWLGNEALSIGAGESVSAKDPVFAHLIFVFDPDQAVTFCHMCISAIRGGKSPLVLLPADLLTQDERNMM